MTTNKANTKTRKPKLPPLTIENAHIIYRNFSGAAKKYNAAGLRNFHVVLEPDQAKALENDGWNVKWPKPEEMEDKKPTLKVWARFDNYPPLIILLTTRGRTELDEETVGQLDMVEIDRIDLKITGSYYEMEGRSGFKAYLNQMFVTLSENDLMSKYNGVSSARHLVEDDEL